MTPKVEAEVSRISGELEQWDEVEAVTLLQFGDDRYDPYFFLSLDVYTRAPVRPIAQRESAYGEITAFESSTLTQKDRFMRGELPFRIEFKLVDRFTELIDAAENGRAGLRNAGTYSFYRVLTAEKLFARTAWLDDLRSRLTTLPEAFWLEIRKTLQDSAEHTYADLRASAVRGDDLYFTISAGRFLSDLCALLFAVNRRYEPGTRHLEQAVRELETVPDSLPANLENFLDQNSLSPTQRAELAELMITSVISVYATAS